jgi:hypothetical protein
MRPNSAGVLATVLLASTCLVTSAVAQQKPGPRGGAVAAPAPHFAAPTPHFAAPAPAPHFSAPAPHISAPAPHFAAPSTTMPHFAPTQRFTAPYIAAPRMATPHTISPRFAVPHAAPSGNAAANIARGTGLSQGSTTRQNPPLARTDHPPATGSALGSGPGSTPGNAQTGSAGNLVHGHVTTPNTTTPTTVGQGPAARGRNIANPSPNIIHSPTRGPILRNPAFADLSRRDPANRALAQSTFSGRFAQSGFARDHDRDRDRDGHHHHFGRVLGFLGPVFWPYAYNDFVDYTFSPYAYDTFWPTAYDDVFAGIYGGYAPAYSNEYASAGTTYGYADGAAITRGSRSGRATRVAALRAGTAEICSGQTAGLTEFPIQRIAQQVQPDENQQALLDELKAATAQALDILRTACPNDLPSTPTGRLAAMRIRVEAMLRAVLVVRPALETFYGALSDEQKERFNAIDNATVVAGQQGDVAQLCGRQAQATALPFARIEQTLRLSDLQAEKLKAVEDASAKAADILKANCPSDQTLTPTARLASMARRLEAMQQVLDTVQPVLEDFYGSLSDEQKAQFNRLNARSA